MNPNIFSPKKDFGSLLKWLNQQVSLTELKLSDFSEPFLAHLKLNAINAVTNQHRALDGENFHFVCYKLNDVPQNCEYNDVLRDTHEEFVYVILEKNTGYISSNSGRLYLQLVIEQGVTQDDINQNSAYMQYYLSCIEAFRNWKI